MPIFKKIGKALVSGNALIARAIASGNPEAEDKARRCARLFFMAGLLLFALAPDCYAGSTSLSSLKSGFNVVLNVIMGGAFIWGTVIIITGMNNQGGSPDWSVVIKGAMIAGASAIMLVFYNVFNVAGDAVPNM